MRPTCLLLLPLFSGAGLAAQDPAAVPQFNRDIRPILSDNCFHCHGPDPSHRKAGLRLDTELGSRALRKGRRAIVPGQPGESELYRRITHPEVKERMPPRKSHKTLSAAQIETLRRWIEAGAAYQDHWAYEPLPRRAAKRLAAADIDRLAGQRLRAVGRDFQPPADPVVRLRRLSFDLTGMPPEAEMLARFAAQPDAARWEEAVEALLASPRHGERMAAWWLDLVRYADTVGYHGDQVQRIQAYRKWVIDAFNAGMPFDQFSTEQLAGDLLPRATREQKIASGYNRVLQTTHEGGAQAKEYLAIYAADRVRNFGSVWLAGTIGCAQCHDHKFDPYTAKDFYSLAAFFADVKEDGDFTGSPNRNPTTRPPEMWLYSDKDARRIKLLEAALKRHPKLKRGQKPKPAHKKLLDEKRAIERRTPRTLVTEAVKPRMTRILPRGNWMDDSGEPVQPAVPEFLPQIRKSGRATRLDLARWLFEPEQPQTARVLVNRLWYLLFGEGLCRSLEDFGAQGEWPDHPELLDALAVELRRSGWDIKHLLRLITQTRVYQQRSVAPPELAELDPDNRLLGRQGRWRLPAEMIRDNALWISGLLVHDDSLASARPAQPAGYYQHLNFPPRRYKPDTGAAQWRRGVYMHWQRQFLHPSLKAFDAPSREECVAQRPRSNTPQAALTLLNDPNFVAAARAFADAIPERLDHSARLGWAFQRATSRRPEAQERAELDKLYKLQRRRFELDLESAEALLRSGGAEDPQRDPADRAAWLCVCRVLLNLKETTTRP